MLREARALGMEITKGLYFVLVGRDYITISINTIPKTIPSAHETQNDGNQDRSQGFFDNSADLGPATCKIGGNSRFTVRSITHLHCWPCNHCVVPDVCETNKKPTLGAVQAYCIFA